MLRDESGIQNSNSDQNSSTVEEDVTLEFSAAVSKNTITSSLCEEMALKYYTEQKT